MIRAGDFARRLGRIEHNAAHGRSRAYRRKAVRALVKRAGAALIVPRGRVVGYRLPDGGVACTKQRYRSQGAADAELARIGRHAQRAYVPVRTYLCEWCGGYHLTSRAR